METSLTMSFPVEQTPERAFAAITDVRAWWTGTIEGDTDRLGAEFTYTVPGIHYCKLRITELTAARRVRWLVVDSALSYVADQQEWTGTTIVFDIEPRDGRTHVRFTQEGLRPHHECYGSCRDAWGGYINGSLRDLIETGA